MILTADGSGSYAHSFQDYQPSARFDGVAWSSVRVQESADKIGPWVTYAHGAISPVDADPTEPASRSFTAPGATLATGWNRVVFLDGAGNQQPTRPVYVGVTWKPGSRDVARLLRGRTFVGGGRSPDFLDESDDGGPTDPTRSEVEELIDDAAADINAKVALLVPDGSGSIAQKVTALGAALLVELGSEDFDQDRYDRLEKLYDTRLAQLLDAAQDEAEGGQVGDADDRAEPSGVASFPAGGTHWDWERF